MVCFCCCFQFICVSFLIFFFTKRKKLLRLNWAWFVSLFYKTIDSSPWSAHSCSFYETGASCKVWYLKYLNFVCLIWYLLRVAVFVLFRFVWLCVSFLNEHYLQDYIYIYVKNSHWRVYLLYYTLSTELQWKAFSNMTQLFLIAFL